MTWEVGTEFVDPGLICPQSYKVIAVSDLDVYHIGDYTIRYDIYRSDTKILELERFVKVVDTTPPDVTLLQDLHLNVGVPYSCRRLVETISDNYDSIYDLTYSPSMLVFEASGPQKFAIDVTDTSGNVTTVRGLANLKYDPIAILEANETVYAIEEMGQFQYYQGMSSQDGLSFRWYNDGHIQFSKIVELDHVYSTVIYLDAEYNNIAQSTLTLYIFQNETYYFEAKTKYNPTLNPRTKVRKYDTITTTIPDIDETGTFNYFDKYLDEYLDEVKEVITRVFYLKWATFVD